MLNTNKTILEISNNKRLVLDKTAVYMQDKNKNYLFARLGYFKRYIDFYRLYDDLTSLGKNVYDAISSTVSRDEQVEKVLKIWKGPKS